MSPRRATGLVAAVVAALVNAALTSPVMAEIGPDEGTNRQQTVENNSGGGSATPSPPTGSSASSESGDGRPAGAVSSRRNYFGAGVCRGGFGAPGRAFTVCAPDPTSAPSPTPPSAGSPGPPPPDPWALARQATASLDFSLPEVTMDPSGRPGDPQIVNLPTWMWMDQGSWAPMSATASDRGLSVTLTATPSGHRWDMGTGETVRCAGPGTPWDPARFDDNAGSPDCGYTYQHSSAGEPGEDFRVVVTVTWELSWVASNGQSGSQPPVVLTDEFGVRVAEVQGIIIDEGGT